RGDRREGLVIVLRSAVQPQCEQAGGLAIVICAEGKLPNAGVVDLQRRAVLPVLAVDGTIQENASPVREQALHAQISGAVLRRNRRVQRAANLLRHGNVAVRVESFPAGGHCPLPETHRGPTGAEGRVLIPIRALYESVRLYR